MALFICSHCGERCGLRTEPVIHDGKTYHASCLQKALGHTKRFGVNYTRSGFTCRYCRKTAAKHTQPVMHNGHTYHASCLRHATNRGHMARHPKNDCQAPLSLDPAHEERIRLYQQRAAQRQPLFQEIQR